MANKSVCHQHRNASMQEQREPGDARARWGGTAAAKQAGSLLRLHSCREASSRARRWWALETCQSLGLRASQPAEMPARRWAHSPRTAGGAPAGAVISAGSGQWTAATRAGYFGVKKIRIKMNFHLIKPGITFSPVLHNNTGASPTGSMGWTRNGEFWRHCQVSGLKKCHGWALHPTASSVTETQELCERKSAFLTSQKQAEGVRKRIESRCAQEQHDICPSSAEGLLKFTSSPPQKNRNSAIPHSTRLSRDL